MKLKTNILTKVIIVLSILSLNIPAYGAFFKDIHPVSPIETEITESQPVQIIPKEKIVRVGIGSNNFSSYNWSTAEIFGTGEFELYNNNTYINTYDSSNYIKVSMNGKIFILKDSEDKVIEKVSGPIIFKTDFGFFGIKKLTRAGKEALYRGKIELVPSTKDGNFHIVNVLKLDDYLKGVVPNEMPVRFGLEALKAQSVAARNYVLSPRVKANPNYDVVDSVASQVYFGANTEKPLSTQAVNETSGIVALYDWNLILAQYSSTAGGYTECFSNAFSDPISKKFPSESKPYLIAKPDYETTEPLDNEKSAAKFYKSKPESFDINSPYFRWEREWNGQEIQDAVQANIAAQSTTGFIKPAVSKGETIGIIKEIKVKKRGDSGKIIELEIITDEQNYTVQKELVIRRLFTNKGKALPSANVVFEQEYNENGDLIYIKAYGGGFGHGVGMSQYGAGFMGTELKMSFDQILKHYYSGITLATEPVVLSNENNNIIQQFYTKTGKATLVVDNKYKTKFIKTRINNEAETIELDTAHRYNQIDLSQYLQRGMNTVKFYYPEKQGGIRIYIEPVGENDKHCNN